MFSRGNWAIFGIDTAQHAAFVEALNNEKTMLSVSQLTADAITRVGKRDTNGINPFRRPRLDESIELDFASMERLAQFAFLGPEQQAEAGLPVLDNQNEVPDAEGYGYGEEDFCIVGGSPLYAFWYVSNEWKDVSDLASLKEQMAYLNYERPYKFLPPADKKTIDSAASATTAAKRKQFPVLIDFQRGRVYIENTNKTTLLAVQGLMDSLGVKVIPVAWKFGDNWLKALLEKFYGESRYKDEFKRAADDAGRFAEGERAEVEDREVASIVQNYFSMTELGSGLWAGLSTPAGINLQKSMPPVVTQAVFTATALLGLTPDAFVSSANITIQERGTGVNKRTGEERVFRKNLVSFELSDQINQVDAGAALLRSFDLPGFKRGIMREIKRTKQVPSIESFWIQWLNAMDEAVRTIESSLRETLELPREVAAGIQPIYGERNDEVIEGNE